MCNSPIDRSSWLRARSSLNEVVSAEEVHACRVLSGGKSNDRIVVPVCRLAGGYYSKARTQSILAHKPRQAPVYRPAILHPSSDQGKRLLEGVGLA